MKRRSSSNPVRSENTKRTSQVLKIRGSVVEGTQIPRPRIRSLSADRLSGRKSTLKATGKISLGQHAPTTPKTPSYGRSALVSMSTSRTGRSPSAERASILMGTKAGNKRDTRPITDKAFQALMIKKIDNYFHSIGQSNILNSNGSIKPMTIKIFVDSTGLLVGILGVKHTLSNLNYVEEVPKIAKKILYPGQVSKAWLKTANAMHAFPNALAWLSWLVELCELKDLSFEQFRLEKLPFLNINGSSEKNKNMFFSILNFYSAWNENNELEETLVAEFLKSEEAHYDVSEETLERARSNYEAEMQKLEAEDQLRAAVDLETKQLMDTIVNLKKDEESIDRFILELDEHIESISNAQQIIKNDCCLLDSDIKNHCEKQEQLKAIIKMQPVSPRERDEIVGKCEDIEKYLKQFENLLQEIQKDIYSRDMKLSAVNHSLTKIILQYNKDIHNHLTGISGINVGEIEIPENVVSSPQSMDILHQITLALTELKEKMQKDLDEIEVLVKPSEVNLIDLQEKVKTLTDDNLELRKKSQEKEAKINKIKSDGKSEEVEIRENIKRLEEKIKSIQNALPDLVLIQKELEEKVDKKESLKRQKEEVEKRGLEFFDKLYAIFASNRKESLDILNKIVNN